MIPTFDTARQVTYAEALRQEHNEQNFVTQHIGHIRTTLSNWAAWLRDSGVDIWSESPSDRTRLTAGRDHYPLEGWRVYLRGFRQRMVAWRQANASRLQNNDAVLYAGVVELASALSSIQSAWPTYVDGQGNLVQRRLTQAERDAFAAAIEAQLA